MSKATLKYPTSDVGYFSVAGLGLTERELEYAPHHMAESAELSQSLAAGRGRGGRGGDGRELLPNDNGGPPMLDVPGMRGEVGVAAVIALAVGTGGGFFIYREEILKYLQENKFTPEQFFEALRDALS